MAKSNILNLQPDSIVLFNVSMHGINAGQTVNYGSADVGIQMLIRRRLSDDDGSVEIVKPIEAPKPKTTKKPTDGKRASNKQNEGDN